MALGREKAAGSSAELKVLMTHNNKREAHPGLLGTPFFAPFPQLCALWIEVSIWIVGQGEIPAKKEEREKGEMAGMLSIPRERLLSEERIGEASLTLLYPWATHRVMCWAAQHSWAVTATVPCPLLPATALGTQLTPPKKFFLSRGTLFKTLNLERLPLGLILSLLQKLWSSKVLIFSSLQAKWLMCIFSRLSESGG